MRAGSIAARCLLRVTAGTVLSLGLCIHSQAQTKYPATPPKARVINGHDAQQGQYPWMVSLRNDSANPVFFGHFCGGALVHPRYVLTAAHCAIDFLLSPEKLTAVIGAPTLSGDQGIHVKVTGAVVHPGYKKETLENDAALLLLDRDVPLSPILPLTAAEETALAASSGTILGWGVLDPDPTFLAMPDTLQEAAVPIRVPHDCVSVYGDLVFFPATQVCAGKLSTPQTLDGVDSCYGDSGGPLVVDMNGTPRLAGIISWGNACASDRYPGVYTRVSAFADWIASLPQPAPVLSGPLYVNGDTVSGQELDCEIPGWKDGLEHGAAVRWIRRAEPFFNEEDVYENLPFVAQGEPLPEQVAGEGTTFVLSDADLEQYLSCQVISETNGARVVFESGAVGPVEVNSAPGDRRAPRVKHLRTRCSKGFCTLTFRAVDRAPSSGVVRVEGVIAKDLPGQGRNKITLRGFIEAEGDEAGVWRVRVQRPRRASLRIFLFAMDRAGNRQRRPTEVRVGASEQKSLTRDR